MLEGWSGAGLIVNQTFSLSKYRSGFSAWVDAGHRKNGPLALLLGRPAA
jgi:hypothetical protein